MNPLLDFTQRTTRRHFFGRAGSVVGLAALSALLEREGLAAPQAVATEHKLAPHFAPKAKRVIYLFQSGGPSHLELFDHKPKLRELQGTELPDSIRKGQRLTGMTSGQKSFPVIASKFNFAQAGRHGAWISELLPHTARI